MWYCVLHFCIAHGEDTSLTTSKQNKENQND